jgi:hypothetical protein
MGRTRPKITGVRIADQAHASQQKAATVGAFAVAAAVVILTALVVGILT